jgi:hypothetical protein
LALNDKIQSAEQLKKRIWRGQLNANFVGKNYPLTISSFNVLLPSFAGVCRDVFDWNFIPFVADDLAVICREKSTSRLIILFFFLDALLGPSG